jgi:hypothetical protein
MTRLHRIIAITLTFALSNLMFVNAAFAAAPSLKRTDNKGLMKLQVPDVARARASRKAALMKMLAPDPVEPVQQDARGNKQYSEQTLEQLRGEMINLVNSIEEMSQLAPGQATDPARFETLRKEVQGMSLKQLNSIRRGLSPTKLGEQIAASRQVVEQYKTDRAMTAQTGVRMNSTKGEQASVPHTSSPGFPVASGLCGGDGPNRIATSVMIASDVVYFIAELVRDEAQDACSEVIVVLGEGGNGSLACLITDGIYNIAHAVNAGLHFCDDDLTGAIIDANYARLGHIHDDVALLSGDLATDTNSIKANDNANTSTLTGNITTATNTIKTNDNTNTASIIANSNANKGDVIINANNNTSTITSAITTATNTITTNDNNNTANIISNALANKNELRDLILRTQIEADLSSTDGSTFVAIFETPQSKGGYLELVRSIVVQTIANLAGASTAKANASLADGDSKKAAGDYKGAYTAYRQAYKTAAK